MRFTLFLSVAILATFSSFSQYRKLPDFGNVEISELKLSDCPFEKNAPAMYFFREGQSIAKIQRTALSSSLYEQMEIHVRIKIFNKRGLDAANIRIRYPNADLVSIKKLSAQTYNLDESGNIVITKLDRANVYDTKLNKRWSEKSFAMPGVKEGSVIEYQYTLDGTYFDKWYFQQEMPVQYSRLVLSLPEELITTPVPYVSSPMNNGSRTEDNNKVSWYEMENIRGLRDEPYMSCDKDYLQRIEVHPVAIDIPGVPRIDLMEQWPKVIKYLLEDQDFGEQLKKDIPRTAELDELLKPVTDPYQKMTIIHRYVRQNMEWNNRDNIWALDGVKSAWKDRKGTSGEINLILINLLKNAGLKTHAILVSTVDNGVVNPALPDLDQFNKVMAYVEIGEKVYVLDAIEKYTPSYLIPREVMATEGLLISKPESGEWGWKTMWDDSHKNAKEIFLTTDIDEKGMMKGTAEIKSIDYARIDVIPSVKASKAKEKEALKAAPEIVIDSISDQNLEVDSLPLMQTINFSMPTTATGDYHYFNVNLFTGLEKNPFIAEERQSDIFYGTNQDYLLDANVKIPDGYQMEDIPKNVRLITPDTSIVFTRRCNYSNGNLSVVMKLEFRSPLYQANEYETYKEFFKMLFDFLNAKFIYKKG